MPRVYYTPKRLKSQWADNSQIISCFLALNKAKIPLLTGFLRKVFFKNLFLLFLYGWRNSGFFLHHSRDFGNIFFNFLFQ